MLLAELSQHASVCVVHGLSARCDLRLPTHAQKRKEELELRTRRNLESKHLLTALEREHMLAKVAPQRPALACCFVLSIAVLGSLYACTHCASLVRQVVRERRLRHLAEDTQRTKAVAADEARRAEEVVQRQESLDTRQLLMQEARRRSLEDETRLAVLEEERKKQV